MLALVQAGLLQGKSIGFLPTRVHIPDTKEAGQRGWGDQVGLVIDEWLLLEYACVFLPANQDSLVEAVSKGAFELPAELLRALGLDAGIFVKLAASHVGRDMAFTPLAEIEGAAQRAVAGVDWNLVISSLVRDKIDRLRGRV